MAKKMKLTQKYIRENLATDKALRTRLFEELLEHLREGYSVDCFSELSHVTIEMMLKTYKDEWDQGEFDKALRQGKDGWEDIGRRQSLGTCLGNSRSWYYNMNARYNWHDKMHVESETKGTLNVNVIQYSKPNTPTA